jgi:hypothetical protein
VNQWFFKWVKVIWHGIPLGVRVDSEEESEDNTVDHE